MLIFEVASPFTIIADLPTGDAISAACDSGRDATIFAECANGLGVHIKDASNIIDIIYNIKFKRDTGHKKPFL